MLLYLVLRTGYWVLGTRYQVESNPAPSTKHQAPGNQYQLGKRWNIQITKGSRAEE